MMKEFDVKVLEDLLVSCFGVVLGVGGGLGLFYVLVWWCGGV